VSMKYSIVIGTHNRANDLRETLQCLARLETPYPWEVIVVDNNSTDSTPAVVRELAKSFPGVLRYVFESEPGRCAALNAGIAVARGEIILTPDDDIRVDPQWLETARRGLERFNCDYVGGQVYPVWLGPRPRWIPDYTCRAWAVVALSDEGPESFEYVNKVPLGANLAFRREVIDVVGWWDTRLGRKAGTLLGQEVRDWCVRARAKGIRGVYLPELRMGHLIPVWRLRKNYFRRWFYWRGISRALIYRQSGLDMEKPEETIFDFRHVKHIAGIPRYLYRNALHHVGRMARAALRRDTAAMFDEELWLWMFLGIARQRWRDRKQPFEWTTPLMATRVPVSEPPPQAVEAR
jgi:glycosyltransferase involved in cell wall biosynthesis